MKAVILAAGQGKRLSSYTQGKPKCLLPLGNESLIEREIRQLRECGLHEKDIYVVGGYKAELLEDIAPNLIVNRDYEKCDNSLSLGIALEHTGADDVLVLDADLCFESRVLEELLREPHGNTVMSIRADDTGESTGIVTDADDRVQAIGKNCQNTGFVYISMFKFSAEVVPDFRNELLKENCRLTWYTVALTKICGRHSFFNHVTDGKWHETDYPEDYEETQRMFVPEYGA